jgi:hypothetical protein
MHWSECGGYTKVKRERAKDEGPVRQMRRNSPASQKPSKDRLCNLPHLDLPALRDAFLPFRDL